MLFLVYCFWKEIMRQNTNRMNQMFFKGNSHSVSNPVNSRYFLIKCMSFTFLCCKMTLVRLLGELKCREQFLERDTRARTIGAAVIITCCGVPSVGSINSTVCLQLRHVNVLGVCFFLSIWFEGDLTEAHFDRQGRLLQKRWTDNS